jgi:hypothetical protein
MDRALPGQPLVTLLGGCYGDSFPLYRRPWRPRATLYRSEGYTRFQLKVGGEPDIVRHVDVCIEQPCAIYQECLAVRRHTNRPFILDEVVDSIGMLVDRVD